MSNPKGYDSTVARIAGNLLSGAFKPRELQQIATLYVGDGDKLVVRGAVDVARMIVQVTKETEPASSDTRAQCEAQKQKAV